MSMVMKPRYYQEEAFEAILAQEKTALVKLPTGSGKTRIFPMLTEHERFSGTITLILAEHEKLLVQAKEKLLICNPDSDIGIVGFGKADWNHKIILGGVDTLSYQHRLDTLKTLNIGLIITDEVHHAVNAMYANIYAACPNAFKVGVSATIDRHDQRDITNIYGPPVYSKTINEMIDEEYLCSIVPYMIRTTNVIDDVSLSGGDYSSAKLERAVNRKDRNECIVQACCEERYGGPDIATVIFCGGTDHAKDQAAAFNRAGIPAAFITQDVSEAVREQHFKDFATGKIRVLTNIEILTEGWDADVRRVVLARPTKSRPLYTQMLGRGTRTAPGKEYCILLDFTDNYTDHALEPCTLEDVLGIPVTNGVDCRETIRREKQKSGGTVPVDGEEKKKRERDTIGDHNKIVEKQLTFRYDWQPISGGAYISTVGNKRAGGDLILYPSKSGGYIVGVSYKETPMSKTPKEVVVARNVPLSWAQSIAEQHGKNLQMGNYHFIDPDATWRKDKPSQKQMTALNNLRKATHGALKIPKDISRGEASELLSQGYIMLRKK